MRKVTTVLLSKINNTQAEINSSQSPLSGTLTGKSIRREVCLLLRERGSRGSKHSKMFMRHLKWPASLLRHLSVGMYVRVQWQAVAVRSIVRAQGRGVVWRSRCTARLSLIHNYHADHRPARSELKCSPRQITSTSPTRRHKCTVGTATPQQPRQWLLRTRS